MVLKHALRDMERIRVLTAETRKEALEIVDHTDLSLVVLDLKMPDTDGFTLYEEIRAKKDIPGILMTGDRSMETLQRIRELSIADYLTKPLDDAIARETVHNILHRNSYRLTD
ncbi:MAG: response regulator [Lachnospiraceae bacterium]|nr:response regulator [Lachnospiraceae bacterium]